MTGHGWGARISGLEAMSSHPKSEPHSVVLVPMGDLDYFSVRRFLDAAGTHLIGTPSPDSVTVDLSTVSFCDSSVVAVMDWVDGLVDVPGIKVVTGRAVDRVLDLLPESSARRRRSFSVPN